MVTPGYYDAKEWPDKIHESDYKITLDDWIAEGRPKVWIKGLEMKSVKVIYDIAYGNIMAVYEGRIYTGQHHIFIEERFVIFDSYYGFEEIVIYERVKGE
jgi:hypothetical protein